MLQIRFVQFQVGKFLKHSSFVLCSWSSKLDLFFVFKVFKVSVNRLSGMKLKLTVRVVISLFCISLDQTPICNFVMCMKCLVIFKSVLFSEIFKMAHDRMHCLDKELVNKLPGQ